MVRPVHFTSLIALLLLPFVHLFVCSPFSLNARHKRWAKDVLIQEPKRWITIDSRLPAGQKMPMRQKSLPTGRPKFFGDLPEHHFSPGDVPRHFDGRELANNNNGGKWNLASRMRQLVDNQLPMSLGPNWKWRKVVVTRPDGQQRARLVLINDSDEQILEQMGNQMEMNREGGGGPKEREEWNKIPPKIIVPPIQRIVVPNPPRPPPLPRKLGGYETDQSRTTESSSGTSTTFGVPTPEQQRSTGHIPQQWEPQIHVPPVVAVPEEQFLDGYETELSGTNTMDSLSSAGNHAGHNLPAHPHPHHHHAQHKQQQHNNGSARRPSPEQQHSRATQNSPPRRPMTPHHQVNTPNGGYESAGSVMSGASTFAHEGSSLQSQDGTAINEKQARSNGEEFGSFDSASSIGTRTNSEVSILAHYADTEGRASLLSGASTEANYESSVSAASRTTARSAATRGHHHDHHSYSGSAFSGASTQANYQPSSVGAESRNGARPPLFAADQSDVGTVMSGASTEAHYQSSSVGTASRSGRGRPPLFAGNQSDVGTVMSGASTEANYQPSSVGRTMPGSSTRHSDVGTVMSGASTEANYQSSVVSGATTRSGAARQGPSEGHQSEHSGLSSMAQWGTTPDQSRVAGEVPSPLHSQDSDTSILSVRSAGARNDNVRQMDSASMVSNGSWTTEAGSDAPHYQGRRVNFAGQNNSNAARQPNNQAAPSNNNVQSPYVHSPHMSQQQQRGQWHNNANAGGNGVDDPDHDFPGGYDSDFGPASSTISGFSSMPAFDSSARPAATPRANKQQNAPFAQGGDFFAEPSAGAAGNSFLRQKRYDDAERRQVAQSRSVPNLVDLEAQQYYSDKPRRRGKSKPNPRRMRIPPKLKKMRAMSHANPKR